MAFHHTADCGLVLTSSCVGLARAGELEFESEGSELFAFDDETQDAYARGLVLLNEGEPVAALARFQTAQVENPWRRHVAVATAVVADMLGQSEECEAACRIGLHHVPGDATLLYHLALALLRQGRDAEALETAGQALDADPDLFSARLLRAMLHLAARRYGAARRDLQLARKVEPRIEDEAHDLARNLAGMLAARTLLLCTGAAAVLAGVILTLLGIAGGELVLAGATAGLVLAWLIARRVVRQVVAPERLQRVRLSPPEGLGVRGPRFEDIVN